jgi:hypothetical protein
MMTAFLSYKTLHLWSINHRTHHCPAVLAHWVTLSPASPVACKSGGVGALTMHAAFCAIEYEGALSNNKAPIILNIKLTF